MKINLLNDYIKEKFGYKLYKISLNAGMSCPNRDGKISTGGCIFCSEGGSGDFAQMPEASITKQIEEGKKQTQKKFKGDRYIAYFQAYTNTYAPVDRLERIFSEAINHRDIEVLSIATRPDCIDQEIAALLGRLNKIKPVWVELGLQTSNSESARYINRGYENGVFEKAVELLRGQNIECIVHMIIGLPGEGREDMLNTIRYISSFDIQGIKLQLLHVLKGTRLAADYIKNSFKIYTLEEYIDILFELIENLREDIVIHRITGDGPKALLIEPRWTANKRYVLNTINKSMKERNLIQGSKYTDDWR